MQTPLQRICALVQQACSSDPGGMRAVRQAMADKKGVSERSESTFYANMNPNGAGKLKMNEADIDEKRLERIKAIILSMTPKERDNPQIINSPRKRRIAMGSGTSVQEVNQLLKQFEQAKQLMKQLKGGKGKLRLPF